MLTPMLAFSVLGLLFMGLALPLLRRRVRPNAWYGLRVSATLADPEVWYEANARSARGLFALGLVQLAFALGLPLVLDLTPALYARINAAVVALGAIVAALLGRRRANRLLAEKQRDQPK